MVAVSQSIDIGQPSPVDTGTRGVYGATSSAQLAGISYRQIDHWEREGVLKPSVQEAKGSGKSRQYSADDIRVLAVLAELSRLGARLQNLRAAAVTIRTALYQEPRWLVATPESFVETCDDTTVTLCLEMNDVSGAWLVDMKAITDRLEL